MRTTIIILGILTGIYVFTPSEIKAQRSVENEEVVEYSVEVNRGAYRSFVESVGDRGISDREFGEWVARNSSIRKKIPGRLKWFDRQTITVVDENGRVIHQSHKRIPGGRFEPVGQFLRSDQFLPGNKFLPGNEFLPDNQFVQSQRELLRMLVQFSRRAFMGIEEKGDQGYVIFFTVTPDADTFEYKVKPGGVAFVVWI
ncbi:MAG: hypothetical protein R3220_02135 [Balneolaceae bacterium]|nr:hypothetical protein [Balneolaceae bacterium]